MIKNGQTFTGSNRPNSNCNRLQIGSFGSGANAILRVGLTFDNANWDEETSLFGIDIRPGNYNPAAPYAGDKNNSAGNAITKSSRGFLTVHDVAMSSMTKGLFLSVNGAGNMVSSNYLAKDWGDYYFFGENHVGYLAFVAGFGHQNQGAVHIDGKLADGEEQGADHTCERFASLSWPIIRRQLSYVSNSSWAGS